MVLNETSNASIHNRYAPYWALGLVVLLLAGLATTWFELGHFGNGYLLDMVGPAWTYILLRGLFTAKADNWWTRFFTPGKTVLILTVACFGIELMQYFNWYASTFDPWDLLAYLSILWPLFWLDCYQSQQGRNEALHQKNAN